VTLFVISIVAPKNVSYFSPCTFAFDPPAGHNLSIIVTYRNELSLDLRAHPTSGPSCGALKCPAMQWQVATATPLVVVLAGHGRQESAGSGRGRYIPAGQAVKGK